MTTTTTAPKLVDLVVKHITDALRSITPTRRPLFVGIQGPQGSGKSTVTLEAFEVLSRPPHSLSVTYFSLDDLYLPHSGLVDVARNHPDNPLLAGRGQPGTHDVKLGSKILKALQEINSLPSGTLIEIPSFDKSLFNGEGDRLPEGSGQKAQAPVDVVILEGWCLGFYPLEDDVLEKAYKSLVEIAPSDGGPPNVKQILQQYSLENLKQISHYMRDYAEMLYPLIDAFVQITPPLDNPYRFTYKWRLEQEHWMKSQNGGRGMSDEQVKLFIDRYMPGYFFFSKGMELGYNQASEEKVPRKFPPWKGRHLRVTIDENRDVISYENL